MGGFADAYRRTGSRVLDNIVGYFDERAKEKERQEVFNQILSAVQGYQNNFQQGQDKLTLDSLEGNVTNPFQPTAQRGSLGAYGPTAQPAKRVMNPLGMTMDDIPTSPEAQTRPVPQKERYEQGQNSLNEFINNIIPLIADPKVGGDELGRLNVLGELFGKQVEGLKPEEQEAQKYDFKEFGNSVFKTSPTGEFDKVLDLPQEQKPGDIEGTYENDKTGTYWTYDKNKGQFIDTGIPYERTAKGGGNGGDSSDEEDDNEKALKDNVSELIANLTNPDYYLKDSEGNYISEYDDKDKPIPGTRVKKSDEDISYAKAKTMQKIKLQLLSPRTYQFVTNLEKKWGRYLPPDKLKSEAEKHYLAGNIGDKELKDLKNYLRYYTETIYGALRK